MKVTVFLFCWQLLLWKWSILDHVTEPFSSWQVVCKLQSHPSSLFFISTTYYVYLFPLKFKVNSVKKHTTNTFVCVIVCEKVKYMV